MTAIVPPIQTSHGYRAPDTTDLLNARVRGIFVRGVYGATGLLSPAPGGGLQVRLAAFDAVGKDGIVSHVTVPQDLDVVAGVSQRILLRSVYNQRAAVTAQVLVMLDSDWATLTSDERLEYCCFGSAAPPALATDVQDADIDYSTRDDADQLARSPWRHTAVDFASLPQPPIDVVRTGDLALTTADFTIWVWTGGNGWNIVTTGDGLFDLADYRVKLQSPSAPAPFVELGRNGLYLPAGGSAVLVAQAPVLPVLSTVSPFDIDMAAPAALTARAQRKTTGPGSRPYLKGRSNVAGTVQAGDLRMGRLVDQADLISIVQLGDADLGQPLSAAIMVVSVVDGAPAFAYMKVGGNSAVIEVNDFRMFQIGPPNPARLGDIAGNGPVVGGERDVGDGTAAFSTYSCAAGAENFYGSTQAGLTNVTAGDGNVRLTAVTNAVYAGRTALRGRGDRGALSGLRPDGLAETSWELDAGLPGVGDDGAFAQLRWLGVASGKLNRPRLATLIGGAAATHDPVNAGLAAHMPFAIPPKLADSLHHHRDKARGVGIASGLAPTSPGGLEVDVAAGVAFVGGELWAFDAATFIAPDGPVSFIYVDGVSDAYAPVLAITTVAATALSTPQNTPVARVVTTGGGAIATHGLQDIRRNVNRPDDQTIRTIGALGHHETLQDAVDWFAAYLAASSNPGVIEFVLTDVQTLAAPLRMAGARGMVLRGARRISSDSTVQGPAIAWSFDGNAIDLGGSADLLFDGLHFRCLAAGGVGANPTTTCFGNQGGGTVGEGTVVRRCSTQGQSQSLFPGAPHQLRYFVNIAGVLNNFSVEDCWADVTDGAVWSTGTANYLQVVRSSFPQSAVSVAGNQFGVAGVSVQGGQDIRVEGCILHPVSASGSLCGDGSGFAQALVVNANRTLLRGNIIHYTGTTGGDRAITGAAHYSVVADNIVESASAGQVGIRVGAIDSCHVTGNVVRLTSATAAAGIQNQSTGDRTRIEGNTVESASALGVGIDTLVPVLSTSASDSYVGHNFVTMTAAGGGSAATGIFLRGTGGRRLLVEGNSIIVASLDGAGCLVGDTIDGAVIQGNSFVGSTTGDVVNGVIVLGQRVQVIGNLFANIGHAGSTDGYAVKTVAGALLVGISGNIIGPTCWRGVLLDGGDLSCQGNQINTGERCVTLTGNVVRSSVSGNKLQPLTSRAIDFLAGGSFGIQFVGNDIDSSFGPPGGLAVVLNAFDVVFQGNRVVTNGTAIQFNDNQTVVSGNSFSGGGSNADYFQVIGTLNDIAIRGNVGNVSCNSLINVGSIDRLDISDNIFDVVASLGGLIQVGGVGSHGLRVCGNTVNMTAGGGLIEAAVGSVFHVYDATVSAQVDGNTVDVNGNFMSDGGRVLYFGALQGTVRGNRVTATHNRGGTFSYALLEVPFGVGVVVEGNNLAGALNPILIDGAHVSNGIKISGADCVVQGNTLFYVAGFGVRLSGTQAGNQVVGNQINPTHAIASTRGIDVNGVAITDFVLNGNRISGIGTGQGIRLGGTSCIGGVVTGNVMSGINGGVGLLVIGSGAGTTCKYVSASGNCVPQTTASLSGGVGFSSDFDAGVGIAIGNMWVSADLAGWSTGFIDVNHMNKAPT